VAEGFLFEVELALAGVVCPAATPAVFGPPELNNPSPADSPTNATSSASAPNVASRRRRYQARRRRWLGMRYS